MLHGFPELNNQIFEDAMTAKQRWCIYTFHCWGLRWTQRSGRQEVVDYTDGGEKEQQSYYHYFFFLFWIPAHPEVQTALSSKLGVKGKDKK